MFFTHVLLVCTEQQDRFNIRDIKCGAWGVARLMEFFRAPIPTASMDSEKLTIILFLKVTLHNYTKSSSQHYISYNRVSQPAYGMCFGGPRADIEICLKCINFIEKLVKSSTWSLQTALLLVSDGWKFRYQDHPQLPSRQLEFRP